MLSKFKKYVLESYYNKIPNPPNFILPLGIKRIFFGDSVFLRISKNDNNQKNLKIMLEEEFIDKETSIFAYSALSLTQYATYLSTIPPEVEFEQVLIPINYRSFSIQWELNPMWQYQRYTLDMIKKSNSKQLSYKDLFSNIDYNNSIGKYFYYGYRQTNFFLDSINSSNKTIDKWIERRKRIFAFNYLYDSLVLEDSKRFNLIKTLPKLFNKRENITFYILPINIEAINFLFGENALAYLSKNIEKLIEEFKYAGYIVHDFSKSIDRFGFFNELEATEHLNQIGRLQLLNNIKRIVK